MKPSNDLHLLIKTLSSSEKAYIKKYADSYGSSKNNYQKILEAIDSQENYDEETLVLKFRKASFAKHFAVVKKQLYDLILKLLRQYHQQEQLLAQVNASIENADILYRKGLYEQALKQLDKAYKLAEEQHLAIKMIEILDWQRHYIGQIVAQDWLQTIDSLLEERQTILRNESAQTKYAKIYYTLLHFVRKYRHVREEEQRQELSTLVSKEFLQEPIEQENFYVRLMVLNIHNIYYFLLGDTLQAKDFMARIIDWWETNPKILKQDQERYMAALNNYLNAAYRIDSFESLKFVLEKVEALEWKTPRLKALYFENVTLWRLNYLSKIKDYKGLANFFIEIEQELIALREKINEIRYLLIRYSMARFYILLGKYEASLTVLEDIFQLKQIDLREDLQLFAQCLALIAHYDLGNHLYIESELRNYRRRIRNKGVLYDLEDLLTHYLQKLNTSTEEKKPSIFKAFEQSIHALIIKNPSLKDVLSETFDILRWIKSKEQGLAMYKIS